MALQKEQATVFFINCHVEIILDGMREMNDLRVKSRQKPRTAGFSLIELMIAVAIVGIIAAVAIPSYKQYIVKSNRAAAQSHMTDIAQSQHQYLVDNRAYTATLADLNGLTTPGSVSKYYTIAIDAPAATPPTFTVTATPKAGTTQADDVTLTIDNAGKKTPPEKW